MRSNQSKEKQVLIINRKTQEQNPIISHLKTLGVLHECSPSFIAAAGLIAYKKLNGEVHKLLIIDLQDKSQEEESKMQYSMDLIMKSYDKKKQNRPYTILVSKYTQN